MDDQSPKSSRHEKAPPQRARLVKLVALNFKRSNFPGSLWVTEALSYADIHLQFQQSGSSTLKVLQQTFGPRPCWKLPVESARIHPSIDVLYVVDVSKQFTLALCRTPTKDYPLPLAPPSSKSRSIMEVMEPMMSLKSIKPTSITFLRAGEDIRTLKYDQRQFEQMPDFPTVFFVLEQPEPDAYDLNSTYVLDNFIDEDKRKIRDSTLLSAPNFLQIPQHDAERLVKLAPKLPILSLQCIHLSLVLHHSIISLIKSVISNYLTNAQGVNICVRLERLLEQLEELFDGIQMIQEASIDAKFIIKTQRSLDHLFWALCDEHPGAVAVRHSFESYQNCADIDVQNCQKELRSMDLEYYSSARWSDLVVSEALASQPASSNGSTASLISVGHTVHDEENLTEPSKWSSTTAHVGPSYLYHPISPISFPPTLANAVASLQAAAVIAAGNPSTARTVSLGNLPGSAGVDKLFNLIKFGPIENVRILGEKACAFISFLNPQTAAAFHADATLKKLTLHGAELKIGWGKPSPVPPQVLLAVQQNNATRNVYLGGLNENTTKAMLRDDLSRFGLIDQIQMIKDNDFGFVHFLSIAVAQKVVATLPTEPAWAGKRVIYGKDRCTIKHKTAQATREAVRVAVKSPAAAAGTPMTDVGFFRGLEGFGGYDPTSPMPRTTASAMALMAVVNGMSPGGAAMMKRTVYLGNIHPETTMEDLCNAIRGGVLQSIEYKTKKRIAFVTFVDSAAASTFHQVAIYPGLILNNRRLRVGWGKYFAPLTPALALAVLSGATRNVYIGGIEEFEQFSEERLKRDFLEFGDIELVSYLKEKNCAFVNFTNLVNAIKAIEGIKLKPEYSNLRIAHGRDRCANPPRITAAASDIGDAFSGASNRARNSGNTTIHISELSPLASTVVGEDDKRVAHLKRLLDSRNL